MIQKILDILSLPKTLVVGAQARTFNPYTLFLPFREGMDYMYILITHLSPFEKRRIELQVPFSPQEELVATWLIKGKPVYALEQVALSGAIPIPDCTTKLITAEKARLYPFKKMFVPKGTCITHAAREESIEFEEFNVCEREKYAEVFGQLRNTNS